MAAQNADADPPSKLRFCGQHCFSYEWTQDRYVSTNVVPGHPNWHSVLTVESFKPQSIILHRVDSENGKVGFTVTMTGRFSAAGNSIVNTAMNGTPNSWSLVWGDALTSIPGEDGPAQRQFVAQANSRGIEPPIAPPPAGESRPNETSTASVPRPLPTRLITCEFDGCDPLGHGPKLWTFNGKQGHGVTGDGEEYRMNLTIERFDSGGVVIRRSDEGDTRGLVVVYTGKLDGDRIVGSMSVTWAGHPNATQTAAWSAQPALESTGHRVNLTGRWQTFPGITDRQRKPIRFRIEQAGDRIKAWGGMNKDGLANPTGENDTPQWQGKFISDTVIAAQYQDAQSTPGHPHWSDTKMYLDEPDHIAEWSDKSSATLQRAGWGPEDVPCDDANSYRVTRNWAFLRGAVAIAQKNPSASVCWLHAAATLGHVRSQGLLAARFFDGSGVEQDFKQAFTWAQRAAQQHDLLGESLVAAMYKEGKGVTADPGLAAYWSAQAANQRSDKLWSMLDTKSPSGFTPREVIGAALSTFGSQLSDYRKYEDRCRNENNADACSIANNLRGDLVSHGVDVPSEW